MKRFIQLLLFMTLIGAGVEGTRTYGDDIKAIFGSTNTRNAQVTTVVQSTNPNISKVELIQAINKIFNIYQSQQNGQDGLNNFLYDWKITLKNEETYGVAEINGVRSMQHVKDGQQEEISSIPEDIAPLIDSYSMSTNFSIDAVQNFFGWKDNKKLSLYERDLRCGISIWIHSNEFMLNVSQYLALDSGGIIVSEDFTYDLLNGVVSAEYKNVVEGFENYEPLLDLVCKSIIDIGEIADFAEGSEPLSD